LNLKETDDFNSRISGSANPHRDFVIVSQGEMASFPAGTTPFFLQIERAQGVPCKESPALDDAADRQHAHSMPFRYSVLQLHFTVRSTSFSKV
jgi:hypothetical protein